MKYFFIKRIIDIVLSILSLIILIPFFVLALIIVLIETKKFPLISQERRLTLNSKGINILKIRTIKNDDEFNRRDSKNSNFLIKSELKNFIPPFCRWLRKTGFDELPQIVNVLKGEMSLIGPRPFTVKDLKLMLKSNNENYQSREKLIIKPGISGLWQIFGRRENGFALPRISWI